MNEGFMSDESDSLKALARVLLPIYPQIFEPSVNGRSADRVLKKRFPDFAGIPVLPQESNEFGSRWPFRYDPILRLICVGWRLDFQSNVRTLIGRSARSLD